jgi:Zn-dependent M28 family amino/carboxypeptidase
MIHWKRALIAILCAIALCACSREEAPAPAGSAAPESAANTPAPASAPAVEASPFTPEAESAAAAIDAADLAEWIRVLSSDEYEGRGPGSAGDAKARAYITQQLEALGLAPGGENGSWEQPVELIGLDASMPDTWTFTKGGSKLDLKVSDEFIAASGVQAETAAIENAEVVFVGYGIEAPEFQWDDYKGVDLEGKVLLMLNNDPDWDPELFQGDTRLYYGRWTYKYESAARQGAAGAIIIHTTPSAGYPWQVVQTSWSGEQFELPAEDEPRIQVKGWVTEDAARKLVSLAGRDLDELVGAAKSRDFAPVALGVTTSLKMPVKMTRTASANVLGLIEGSDPQLKNEVVIYTAHHDHLGIGTPDAEGDTIYNGARDNATGVAMLLGIAKALKALPQPPRRSTLMLFVAAEEQGLIGSRYYSLHPTFPPGRMAAVINFDSGNIWGRTRDVTYVGMGKSTLDEVARRAAGHQNRIVQPDEHPDRGSFYRSDQFSLARIGVPALYFDAGSDFIDRPADWGLAQDAEYTEKHYHQPSDEFDPAWDLSGLVEDAQLGFWCGVIIGNADEMPAWNPGDEFEAARKAALGAVQQ